jgi:hypothetical protein
MVYSPDLAQLLSSGREGRRQRSTVNCADEIAPPHSMTSSARARIDSGIVEWSALDSLPEVLA